MNKLEKDKIIYEAVVAASKILVSAFRMCELETHIETMIIDDDTKEEFILKFYSSKGFDRFFNEAKSRAESEGK